MTLRFCPTALLTLLMLAFPASASPASELRPLTPGDLFTLEEVGQASLSPDGRWLAYVIQRPKETALMHARPFLGGNDRADLWLFPTAGGEPRKLTDGAVDGSGWWAPTWSPDSRRLAALSTRRGNAHLWMWERPTDRWTQLTDRGVDLSSVHRKSPFAWLSERHLLCPVLPEGERPDVMTVEMRAAEISMREWPKAWRGKEPTAFALESGVPAAMERRPQAKLLLIDVEGGSRAVATGVSFRELHISPDRKHIAALRQVGVVRPEPDEPLAHGPNAIFEVVVLEPGGKQVLRESVSVDHVQPRSPTWSPDGTALALLGRGRDSGARAVICSLRTGTCAGAIESDSSAVAWSANGRLLVLAAGGEGGRQDWWSRDETGEWRNLTAAMKAVPRALTRQRGSDSLVGIAGGEMWRIHPDGTEPRSLTGELEPTVLEMIWPGSAADERAVRKAIVGVRSEGAIEWHQIDLASGTSTALLKPSTAAMLVEFDPEREVAVLTARDRSGTYLWVARPPFAKPVTVVETNTHLREIEQTEFRRIEYQSEGRTLNGWVLLPYGYRDGKRYPLIAVVYGGAFFGPNPPGGHLGTINNVSSLNHHLLAAHGYAVLFPSIPLKPPGAASDPYLELTKGVLPAVDRTIELGIADPDRVGVLGQSYGGYTTYGLIAQTDRFRAAVSLAGLTDLISLYGILDPRFRYDWNAHERVSNMSQAETGQIRMGRPPWKDVERYVRNSPIFHVEQIDTPVLIVHGDSDYIAMQQGEQLFTALYRQNKRAALVRYLGEGHVIQSPANIRDLWQRIYEWFDHFLRAPD